MSNARNLANFLGTSTTVPSSKIVAASLPSGTVLKVQTNPITAFGKTDLTTSYADVAGTEQSFTRAVSNSKILVCWNLKLTTFQNTYIKMNRKIGSGSYAVVNAGATGTDGGRTSEAQVLGTFYNTISVNAMGYGTHAYQYTFLDESGEGLTNTTDAITYKITVAGINSTSDFFLNISGYDGTGYNHTTESSVTFMEIAG
jgi:hypothetical protein